MVGVAGYARNDLINCGLRQIRQKEAACSNAVSAGRARNADMLVVHKGRSKQQGIQQKILNGISFTAPETDDSLSMLNRGIRVSIDHSEHTIVSVSTQVGHERVHTRASTIVGARADETQADLRMELRARGFIEC
jgi:hypothetical protein